MLRYLGNRYLQLATRTRTAMLQSNRAIVVSPFVRFFSLNSKNTNPGGHKPCVDNAELQKLIRTIESHNMVVYFFLVDLAFLNFREIIQLKSLSKNQESREED